MVLSWAQRAYKTWLSATVVAAACVLAVSLASCSRPEGLGPCYESLPVAEAALHVPKPGYMFKGVKLVSPKGMDKLVHKRFPGTPPAHFDLAAGTKVCAFAFTGHFASGQVSQAPQGASGKAAIVLTTTDRHLMFSFVIAKLPERFSRTFTP